MVVDTSSLFGIHSSRLFWLQSWISRYFPLLAHPIPIYLSSSISSSSISSSICASLPPFFRRRIDTPRVRRCCLLLVYLRVVHALFRLRAASSLPVLSVPISIPLYYLQLYIALVFRSVPRRGYPPCLPSSFIIFTHRFDSTCYCTAFVPQALAMYQMYIVYNIILLICCFLLCSVCVCVCVSRQVANCGINTSICCPAWSDSLPCTSISAKCKAESGRDCAAKYVRDHDPRGPTPTTGPDSVRACRQPKKACSNTPFSALRKPRSQARNHMHIYTRDCRMVVLRSWRRWLDSAEKDHRDTPPPVDGSTIHSRCCSIAIELPKVLSVHKYSWIG
ncbi:hypothetical protein L227DRAFT_318099 [Lentinus tigrinus ALCF2SS1-6]|uniref:Uncharacterized protein n=1 Tax=Lentinus tigrinus ALCF2SS1-6 TaxID=1328759 RepID=A0A5C2SLD9_9APHY|nr:hypothetical protein L227DRAFT_318099 [Lentinus tigrinus ALCF2SS1-6]